MPTRKLSVVALLLLLSGLVATHHGEPVGTASLHVGIDDVKAAGSVQPVAGVTSAGQPDEEALEVFAKSGYTTVIDLRGTAEARGLDEAEVVQNLGMSYVPFPITGSEAISFENAARLRQLIGDQEGPVLVHCASGNRVGALLALAEALDGAGDEQALATGREAGLTRLEPVVRERLAEYGQED